MGQCVELSPHLVTVRTKVPEAKLALWKVPSGRLPTLNLGPLRPRTVVTGTRDGHPGDQATSLSLSSCWCEMNGGPQAFQGAFYLYGGGAGEESELRAERAGWAGSV